MGSTLTDPCKLKFYYLQSIFYSILIGRGTSVAIVGFTYRLFNDGRFGSNVFALLRDAGGASGDSGTEKHHDG